MTERVDIDVVQASEMGQNESGAVRLLPQRVMDKHQLESKTHSYTKLQSRSSKEPTSLMVGEKARSGSVAGSCEEKSASASETLDVDSEDGDEDVILPEGEAESTELCVRRCRPSVNDSGV